MIVSSQNSCFEFRILFMLKKRRKVDRDHKPSSVIPTPLFSGNRKDGHLSGVMIAQGLKRPYPPRLSPARGGGNSNGLFFPSPGNGAYLVLLRVGFTQLPQSLGALVSSYLAFSPLFRLSPGRYVFCGTFLIPREAGVTAASQGTVRVTDHPALRSSDFPLLPILRRSDHLFPVNSPPFLRFSKALAPAENSHTLSETRGIMKAYRRSPGSLPFSFASGPNRPVPFPGSPWKSHPDKEAIDFPARDSISCFAPPPNRESGYSGDTERGYCFFEPR